MTDADYSMFVLGLIFTSCRRSTTASLGKLAYPCSLGNMFVMLTLKPQNDLLCCPH